MNSIKCYLDSCNMLEMLDAYNNKLVHGFTTNPSLMRKAKIDNYLEFVKQSTNIISNMPISFEVFADDLSQMEHQARIISEFGNNIFVKIPITNTKGESTRKLIKTLLDDNIKVNVTAIFTRQQIQRLLPYINKNTEIILSIFSGRIADTGVNPNPIVDYAIKNKSSNMKILWASCREVYNVYEAETIGCDIITISIDILKKLSLKNKNLEEYSLETVKMFYDDALASKYDI